MKARFAAWLLVVLLLLGAGAWLFRLLHPARPAPQADQQDFVSAPEEPEEALPQPVVRPFARMTSPAPEPVAAPRGPTAAAADWRQRYLVDGLEVEPLPREQIENWLRLNRTNAESLLAARQAGGGREYLFQALTNYPHDPRVLFSALALDDSPEAKRDRLERFKEAAPENALPDYLSAREHFKNGQPEEAIRDLLAASDKDQFCDYSIDAMQNCEELYLAAGKSAGEAKALGCSSAMLPHLSQLRALARDMADLQRQYLAAGDVASAENLADYGVQLSQHLITGGGSTCVIDQLVGLAVEKMLLKQLDQETHYEFLQGTVRDRMEQLAAQQALAKENAQFINQWWLVAGETDLVNYFERFKLYGENAAAAWARQRQATP